MVLKIERYTRNDEARVVEFIRKIQVDAEPDKEILSRSVLIKDDQDIVGMVSYESHGDMAVIRYFLYDARVARTDIVVGMFFELYKKAHEDGVKQLIAQVPSQEGGMLFEMLGFTKIMTHDQLNFIDANQKNIEIMSINLK